MFSHQLLELKLCVFSLNNYYSYDLRQDETSKKKKQRRINRKEKEKKKRTLQNPCFKLQLQLFSISIKPKKRGEREDGLVVEQRAYLQAPPSCHCQHLRSLHSSEVPVSSASRSRLRHRRPARPHRRDLQQFRASLRRVHSLARPRFSREKARALCVSIFKIIFYSFQILVCQPSFRQWLLIRIFWGKIDQKILISDTLSR